MTTPNNQIKNPNIIFHNFVEWKNKLHSELRAGKLMFDVPKHHKWLDEVELFTHYLQTVTMT